MSGPFEALGLSEGATVAEVKARWRDLARLHHPDAGGEVPSFARLNQAYREALCEAESRPCPECGGRGKVKQTYGFSSILTDCPSCK